MNNKKYHIILFNNKKKKRVLFSSNIRKTVNKKYSELTKKTKPIFPLLLLNDLDCEFELAVVTKSVGVESGTVVKDSMGRWVTTTINHDDFSFVKLELCTTTNLRIKSLLSLCWISTYLNVTSVICLV